MKRVFLICCLGMMGATLATPVPTPEAPVPVPQPPAPRIAPSVLQAPLPLVTPTSASKRIAPVPQEVFSFGAKLIGGQIEHTFSVTNPGKTVLQIKTVSSSCSCTRVVQFSQQIAPGSAGSISTITKLDKVGSKSVLIAVDLGGKVLTYQIVGDIVAPLAASTTPMDSSDFVMPKDWVAKIHASAIQLAQTNQQPDTFLDLRPPAKFSEAHIPNAINVPILGLSMRSNFAHTPLILVGSGVDDLALDIQVKACRKMGFQSVHYLKGGMRLWQQNGGALTGVLWNNPHLNTVPSLELVQSARHTTWTLFIPKSLAAPLTTLPPLCTTVTFNSKDDLQTKVKTVADGNIGLFVPGPDLPKMTASLVAPPNCPLFFVTDGWSAYVQLATTEALAQASHLVTISSGSMAHRIKNCPTCP